MALSLSMWVILILSAPLTTLGQAGPWGRALGPKVAEEAGPWGLSLGSCHVLRARGGEDKVPARGMLWAARLAFIFKSPYHFSGVFFFFLLPGAACRRRSRLHATIILLCPLGPPPHTSLLCEDREILGTGLVFRFLGLADCRRDCFKQTLCLTSG